MEVWQRVKLFITMQRSPAADKTNGPPQAQVDAYMQQQAFLRQVKEGLLEVATAKEQLARQIDQLRQRVRQLALQAQQALEMGRDDLARAALGHKQLLLEESERLEAQLAEVRDEEKRLTAHEQRLADRVDAFSRYGAVRWPASRGVEDQARRAALRGVAGDLSKLSMALGRAQEKTQRLLERAAAVEGLVQNGRPGFKALRDSNWIEWPPREPASRATVEHELAALKRRQTGQGHSAADGKAAG